MHDYIPIFHRQSFTSAVAQQGLDCTTPLLVYAIIALAAGCHPDPTVRSCQQSWFDEAKSLYAATGHSPDHPLETLQAAACILLQALITAEHSTAWLVLGKAWRQAVALGFHRMDGGNPVAMPGVTPPTLSTKAGNTQDWRRLEQCRRVVWMLFMLDRGMCFPIGLTHAIDDRQLRINLPMTNDVFQGSDVLETSQAQEQPLLFTHNYRRMLSLIQNRTRRNQNLDDRNPWHYLVLAYMLLGRIMEHLHSPEYGLDDDDTDHTWQSERQELEQDLGQTRLVLPRWATELAASSYTDFKQVVWLKVVMNVNTVLLDHRPAIPKQQHQQHNNPSAADRDTDGTGSWQHCVAAACNTALLIREASRVSTDLVVNPHIAAPIFTCGRVLVIEHLKNNTNNHTSGHKRHSSSNSNSLLQTDLEVLFLIFDRMSEAFGGVGNKFRDGLLYHLGRSPAELMAIKQGGSRQLLTSCGTWPQQQNQNMVMGGSDSGADQEDYNRDGGMRMRYDNGGMVMDTSPS